MIMPNKSDSRFYQLAMNAPTISKLTETIATVLGFSPLQRYITIIEDSIEQRLNAKNLLSLLRIKLSRMTYIGILQNFTEYIPNIRYPKVPNPAFKPKLTFYMILEMGGITIPIPTHDSNACSFISLYVINNKQTQILIKL